MSAVTPPHWPFIPCAACGHPGFSHDVAAECAECPCAGFVSDEVRAAAQAVIDAWDAIRSTLGGAESSEQRDEVLRIFGLGLAALRAALLRA